jgi:hypothetical protein
MQRCNFYSNFADWPVADLLSLPDTPSPHDRNVVALIKGHERYIFIFDNESRTETMRTLGRFASDPALSFSWFDAAKLSMAVREAI